MKEDQGLGARVQALPGSVAAVSRKGFSQEGAGWLWLVAALKLPVSFLTLAGDGWVWAQTGLGVAKGRAGWGWSLMEIRP